MRIAVPRETAPGERRVGLVPDGVARLVKAGHSVTVETGAGAAAGIPDDEIRSFGVTQFGPVGRHALIAFIPADSRCRITAAGCPDGESARTATDVQQRLVVRGLRKSPL